MIVRLASAVLALIVAIPRARSAELPNIVFLLADDLGYGDIGCFGQEKIRTPNIDALASRGMRLVDHYAGNNVCAPSRCTLMTGKHPGHAYIRTNRKAEGPEGQEPVPPGELALPLTLDRLGYAVGGFGKWGLGPVGSTGDPLKQGFDRFFGYNCQGVAHNYYPTHLWDNSTHLALDNPDFSAHQPLPEGADADDPASFAPFQGETYAPDLIAEQARAFVRANRDRPFFLYFPTTVPHLALQVPDDSLEDYEGTFPDEPYRGDEGYLPHPRPRAAYAAMVTRLDREVGRIVALIEELGLGERTIVVFTSDNGPLSERFGGTDTAFFNSNGGLRGRKGNFYEAGFRVPGIVRWQGTIEPGTSSDRITGFEDWLPTLLDLIGHPEAIPSGIDGISFAPTLRGVRQEPRPFLYRESPSRGGQQAIRVGDWKAIRANLNPSPRDASKAPGPIELYNLKSDPAESRDVAADHPAVVAKLAAIMEREHTPSALFPIRALD